MNYEEIQMFEYDMNNLYNKVRYEANLFIVVSTNERSFTTSYKNFMNIPDENSIQVYDMGYFVISYSDIVELTYEVEKHPQ